MGAERFKLKVNERSRNKKDQEKRKQTRNSLTAQGRGYRMVRSKHLKGPDGYGRVISLAREKLIEKNGGKDPGENMVAAHFEPGAHFEKDGGKARFKTRGWNTGEANRLRAKKK